MKKKIIILIVILLLLIGSSIFSINKFGVINPFSSCFNMLKILCTDIEYTVAQNNPYKIIFAQSVSNGVSAQELLEKYMSDRGFTREDTLGGLQIYTNGEKEERISFSVNGYYSIWEWV